MICSSWTIWSVSTFAQVAARRTYYCLLGIRRRVSRSCRFSNEAKNLLPGHPFTKRNTALRSSGNCTTNSSTSSRRPSRDMDLPMFSEYRKSSITRIPSSTVFDWVFSIPWNLTQRFTILIQRLLNTRELGNSTNIYAHADVVHDLYCSNTATYRRFESLWSLLTENYRI